MSDLIDTTEMYLRTIFELEEEGIVPLRARIAERLHQSGPTVSQTVARMERDGLLTVEGDRHLELTDEGRALATRGDAQAPARRAAARRRDRPGLGGRPRGGLPLGARDVRDRRAPAARAARPPDGVALRQPDPRARRAGRRRAAGGETSAVLDALTLLSTTATAEGRPVVIRRISEQLQENADLLRVLADQGVRPGRDDGRPALVEGSVSLDGRVAAAGVAHHLFLLVDGADEQVLGHARRQRPRRRGCTEPSTSAGVHRRRPGARPGRPATRSRSAFSCSCSLIRRITTGRPSAVAVVDSRVSESRTAEVSPPSGSSPRRASRPGIGLPKGETVGLPSRVSSLRSTASLMTCSQRQASSCTSA